VPSGGSGRIGAPIRQYGAVVGKKAKVSQQDSPPFSDFTADGRQYVIAFNSDSPHLAPRVLDSAFEILAKDDVVVGPTHDGGYYLVGAKAAHPALFESDPMGTKSALDRLLTRTKDLELSTGFTEPFYDIDVANDLILLARNCSSLRGRPQELQAGSANGSKQSHNFAIEWEAGETHALAQAVRTRPILLVARRSAHATSAAPVNRHSSFSGCCRRRVHPDHPRALLHARISKARHRLRSRTFCSMAFSIPANATGPRRRHSSICLDGRMQRLGYNLISWFRAIRRWLARTHRRRVR